MRRSGPKEPKKKKSWQLDAEEDDDEGTAPSEAFQKLKGELEARESAALTQEAEEEERRARSAKAHAARAAEKPKPNPVVFLDVRIGKDAKPRRIVLELWADRCPKTAENFRCLATGEKGRGRMGLPLCFTGVPFHRIIPGFMAQGGDITHEDGSGGESIYGGKFEDERRGLQLPHDSAGLLSMANSGPASNGSQFFVTFGWVAARAM